jgi:hypothetical protein
MQLCGVIRQSCGCPRVVRQRTIITIVQCCSTALEGGRTRTMGHCGMKAETADIANLPDKEVT